MSRKDIFVLPLDRIVSRTLNKASSLLSRVLILLLLMGMALPAAATLTIENITWGTKGLDSNDVSTGPNQFPEGVRVCSDVDATNTTVTFSWNDALDSYTSDTNADPYINLRDDTLSVLTLSISAGECMDAYFEVEINRDATAYDNSREFFMTADDGVTAPVTTPANREVYVEYLISQSRNAVTGMEVKLSTDPDTSYASVAAGATMTLVVGETYHIKMNATTATQGYEQLESFVNFPNIIFQVLSVDTTYSAASGLGSLTSSKLYSDACVWDDDSTSANYRSCQLVGKAGGDIETIYELKILQIPGAPLVNPQPLTTLIHDFSGSSYHYNADLSASVRFAHIIGSTIEKSFLPKNINPGGTSTLTFTITNPRSSAISNVNFIDDLPTGMNLANTNVSYTGCGSPSPASGALTDPLTFTSIDIAAFGVCTIDVTVTVPMAGIYFNTSENLFIDAFDTLSNATDTLVVTDLPPPPSSCFAKSTMATWDMPDATLPPNAVLGTDVTLATASTTGGTESIVAGVTTNAYALTAPWPTTTPVTPPPTPSSPYFEFSVDSNNYGGLEISLQPALLVNGDWASNANNHLYVYASIDGGATFTLQSTTNIVKGGFVVPIVTAAPTSALTIPTTIFRVTVDTAKNTPITAAMDNIIISGCPRPDAPTVIKSFVTDPIALGATSTLTFTFQNPNLNDALFEVGFSDTLPSGVVVADMPNVTFPACTTGSITSPATDPDRIAAVTAMANTSLIDMTEVFTLSAAANCLFTVDVKGIVDGTYTNTTTNITSLYTGPNTAGGANVGYGQDDITITPTPQITKVFGSSSILTGATTTLSFSITNPSVNGIGLTNVSFSDTLPGGVIVDTPNGLSGSCGGGTITAVAGSSAVSLSGTTLTAGGGPGSSCSFSINVQGTTAGLKTNTTGVVTSDQGDGNTSTANLLVKDPSPALAFLKQVGTTSNGPWTNYIVVTVAGDVYYRFTVENTGDIALASVNISDPDIDALTPTTANCSWEDGDGNPLTAAFTLPVADADEGHIAICVLGAYAADAAGLVNTATTSNGSGAANASDTAEYAITELSLDKSVTSGDPFSAAGDTITYDYLVTNTGGATLTGNVTVADDKTTATCPAGDLVPAASLICTASYTVTSTDVTAGQVTNIATATIANAGNPIESNSDTVTVYTPPTVVTIGKVDLDAVQISDFLAGLGVYDMSIEALLALLVAWDADLAASLADADRQAIIDALINYLDPDGDGQTAVLRWDTLEERGTIGFYVGHKVGDGEWELINNDMLPGLIIAPMGGEYQLADPSAEAGITYEYLLIEQEARGSIQAYGPFTLEME